MSPKNNKSRQVGFYILILVILLTTVYTMTRGDRASEGLTYSEVVDLFKQEKVEKFALDTDGNMTLELRSPYKGNDKYTYQVSNFSVF